MTQSSPTAVDATADTPPAPAPAEAETALAETPKAPPKRAPMPDALAHLILGLLPKKLEDVGTDRKRLNALSDSEDEEARDKLLAEIGRTVMAYVAEQIEDVVVFGNEVLKFRNWAAEAHAAHALHLNGHSELIKNHEERMLYLESVVLGGESQLSPEDAELFAQCAIAAQEFAEEALKHTTEPAGRQKLQEIVDLARAAQERVAEIEIDSDDDDDDESPPAAVTQD